MMRWVPLPCMVMPGFIGSCDRRASCFGDIPASGFVDTPITPWGQLVGAVIMFGVLGFLPCWIVAGLLKAMGVLRIPERIEIVGLDLAEYRRPLSRRQ